MATTMLGAPRLTLDPLRTILDWLDEHGFAMQGGHSTIAGVPVQFLVAWTPLVAEADRIRQTLGRPTFHMTPWDTTP